MADEMTTPALHETRELIVRGGLPGGLAYASAGTLEWHREPGESEASFLARVRREAQGTQASYLIFSGLSNGDHSMRNERVEGHLQEHARLSGGGAVRADDTPCEKAEPIVGANGGAKMEKVAERTDKARKGK
jgi:hypothetical protein